jgi:hypothetical protein
MPARWARYGPWLRARAGVTVDGNIRSTRGAFRRYSGSVDDAAFLSLAAARSRPVVTADARVLDVPGPLGALLEGGVRRGSTVVVGSPAGGVSLALALVAAATTGEGAWAAAVGLPSLGLVAAADLGVKLERLALVPNPGDRWPVVAAALLDGIDLLLVGLPGRARAVDARRLVARAREQGTVLVVLEPPGSRCWPETPDLRLSVVAATWAGLGCGHGYLRSRRVEVMVSGRRAAARERRAVLWLPGPPAEVAPEPRNPPVAGLPGLPAALVG